MFCLASILQAQPPADRAFSRVNTFGSFVEYSNDSSHIILGSALNRKIGGLGFQYERRVVHRGPVDMYYEAEIRPAMIESDPMQQETDFQTLPTLATGGFNYGPVVKCTTQTFSY